MKTDSKRITLQLSKECFQPISTGAKTFLLWWDCGQRVGDELKILEFDTLAGSLTGSSFYGTVSYKTSNADGLREGWCILGISHAALFSYW